MPSIASKEFQRRKQSEMGRSLVRNAIRSSDLEIIALAE